ncbi:WDR8 protein isoform 3 family protein [Besnoitia besnoiti]|uniref:WDR8 protein isoform 3 family protein n=1 Tax=Besnoitia besnoiti TaxID=94643 RepID=A0A2A9M503_BESBE|nr:WDR8 protein isoform 3 family protein [Besnoitia besnoiti]PFH33568.1 WDR8 protein isoform 3 family protein [Besnoitia besnoiti]
MLNPQRERRSADLKKRKSRNHCNGVQRSELMALTPAFHMQSALARWSPDGELLATVTENLVKMRRVTAPIAPAIFPAPARILQLAWAPDSQRFLCLLADHTVRVFSVTDHEWSCGINEGLLPVAAASWAPDSLHVLTASDCKMRLSVWSLCESRAADALTLVVHRPKFASAGNTFSPSGKLWAVCTRVDCKDFLEIFRVSPTQWSRLRDFEVCTSDLQDLLWTPSETSLVVWDSPVVCRFLVYHIAGHLLFKFEPQTEALGIRSVQIEPKADALLVSGYDETIRVFSLLDWSEPFPPMRHEEKVAFHDHLLVVREEVNDAFGATAESELASNCERDGEPDEAREAKRRAPVVYRQQLPPKGAPEAEEPRGRAEAAKSPEVSGAAEAAAEDSACTGQQRRDGANSETREESLDAGSDPTEDGERRGERSGEAHAKKVPWLALPTEKLLDAHVDAILASARLSFKGTQPPRMRSKGTDSSTLGGVAQTVVSPCGAFVASHSGKLQKQTRKLGKIRNRQEYSSQRRSRNTAG